MLQPDHLVYIYLINKIPSFLLEESDPIFSFNKLLLDALNELIVSVKINTAFYEVHGSKGWETLEKTIDYINNTYPNLFTIADAKRGDHLQYQAQTYLYRQLEF